jgi:hypothetical protein
MSPFDLGWYEAHRSAMGSVGSVERRLARARRSRARWYTRWLLPSRRRYLDGFIRHLELDLERRARDSQTPFRHEESACRTSGPDTLS